MKLSEDGNYKYFDGDAPDDIGELLEVAYQNREPGWEIQLPPKRYEEFIKSSHCVDGMYKGIKVNKL